MLVAEERVLLGKRSKGCLCVELFPFHLNQ